MELPNSFKGLFTNRCSRMWGLKTKLVYFISALLLVPTIMSLPSRRATRMWVLPGVNAIHCIGTSKGIVVITASLQGKKEEKEKMKLDTWKSIWWFIKTNSSW